MSEFQVGDKVRRRRVNVIGTVCDVTENGSIRVQWGVNKYWVLPSKVQHLVLVESAQNSPIAG